MPLHQLGQGLGGSFHLDGMHLYLQLRLAQLRLGALFRLMSDGGTAREILRARNSLQEHSRHDHDPYTRPVLAYPDAPVQGARQNHGLAER